MNRPDDHTANPSPNGTNHPEPTGADPARTGQVTPGNGQGSSPIPFRDLRAPAPTAAPPPTAARWLAFAGILVGGLLGGLIGYGTGDLMSGSSAAWATVGLLVGALAGAIGVGIVAGLTLRAMNEWKATPHPEAADKPGRFVLRRTSATDHASGPPARPGGSRGPGRRRG